MYNYTQKKKGKYLERFFALFLTVALVFSTLPMNFDKAYADDTVRINDPMDFMGIKNKNIGKYILESDITLPSSFPTDIDFNGEFDGNGHTINISGNGIFSKLGEGAVIKNLTVKGTLNGREKEPSGDYRYLGSIASVSSGKIENCLIDIEVLAEPADDASNYVGGVVGKVDFPQNAPEDNDFIAVERCAINLNVKAKNDEISEYVGAVVGYTENSSIKIKNTYWAGREQLSYSDINLDNSENLEIAVLNSQSTADKLNAGLTGFKWQIESGKLCLKKSEQGSGQSGEGTESEARKGLKKELEDAKNLKKTDYDDEGGWEKLQKALNEAKALLADSSVQDEVINAKTQEIQGIVATLRPKQNQEEQIGFDLSKVPQGQINKITNADELANIQQGGVYVLTKDIEITSDWALKTYNKLAMNAKLDGAGHKIIAKKANAAVFKEIGSQGIVQNLGVEGKFEYSSAKGFLTDVNAGMIVNCYINVSENNCSWLRGAVAGTLNGGKIVRCYVKTEKKVNNTKFGALVGISKGRIEDCYYENVYTKAVYSEQDGHEAKDCQAFSSDQMKSRTMLDLLNKNRKVYLKKWGRAEGTFLPIHSDIDHAPAVQGNELPYKVRYIDPLGSVKTIAKRSEKILVNAALGDRTKGAGQLEILPKTQGGDIPQNFKWFNKLESNDISVGRNDGKVYANGSGINTVELWTVDPSDPLDRKITKIMEFNIESKFIQMDDLQVFVVDSKEGVEPKIPADAVNYAKQKYTFAGKIYKNILLKAKFEGSNEFIEVNPHNFKYTETSGNKDFVISQNEFVFNAPGTAKLEINFGSYTTYIDLESTYVAVESIKPIGDGETFTVHERNSMSQNWDFMPILGDPGNHLGKGKQNVIVTPKNASYKDRWEIRSEDESIAKYSDYITLGIIPFKTGTVKLTAISKDPNLTKEVKGDSTITIAYKNSITKIELPNKDLEIKEDEEKKLDIKILGSDSTEEHVSEPKIKWTYKGNGRVQIAQNSQYLYQGQGKNYVADDRYVIRGISAGTVTATGTPIDKTNNVAPVVLNITVKGNSNVQELDVNSEVKKALAGGKAYIEAKCTSGFKFGDEWSIFTLARAGKAFTDYEKQIYLNSVREVFAEGNPAFESNQKPTTIARTIIGLGAMEIDAEKITSYEFLRRLLNNPRMKDGSNEAIFALIALDTKGYSDAGYTWNREKLIDEILSYQNAQTGGFSLNVGGNGDVDITAMALQALAKYEDKQKVKSAIDKAMAFLKKTYEDSGFNYNSSESTAQVILTLSTLKQNPLKAESGFFKNSRKNILTGLLRFYVESEKGFKHGIADSNAQLMSTDQSTYALVSYIRFTENRKSLYDFSDIEYKMPSTENTLKAAKERLNALIKRAKEIIVDKSKYTKDTIDNLLLKLKDAEELTLDATSSATVKEFERRIANLNKAISDLKQKEDENQQGGSGNVPNVSDDINVDFTLKGMKIKGTQEQTWIAKKVYKMPKNSSVYDVFDKALKENNIEYGIRDQKKGGYVYSIKSPTENDWLSEFTNGNKSGWMYTVNGKHPSVGLIDYKLKNGDDVVWHYVNDYIKEGSFGGGGGGVGAATAEDKKDARVEKTAEKIESKVETRAKVDAATGKAEAKVDANKVKEQIADIIKKAEKFVKEGKKDAVKELKLEVKANSDAKAVIAVIPKDAVKNMADAIDNVHINTNLGNVSLDKEALKDLSQKADKEVSIALEKKEIKDTPLANAKAEDKKKAEGRPIVEMKATVDGKDIATKGNMKVNLKYEQKAGEDPEAVVVYKVMPNGNMQVVTTSEFEAGKEQVKMDVANAQGTYVIGYNKVNFVDSDNHWAKKNITFLAAREIVKGKSEGKFEPNGKVTRAEFVQILSNLSGADIAAQSTSKFGDVAEGSWYAAAVAWAVENGITSGTGNGSFSPDAAISRQDMAVMIERYMKNSKKTLNVKNSEMKFADANSVADYAKAAVGNMQKAGIINGAPSGNENFSFNPKAGASRAETATMIANYIKN